VIDTHCHLTHRRLAPDVEPVVRRALEAGVEACVTIGTGVEDAEQASELALRFPGIVHCTAGIDPFTSFELAERFDDELRRLEELLRGRSFCALGEIGLDYHYELDPKPVQAHRLERQLELARALDLPVVLHVREAHDDMAAVLRGHPRSHGVVHSFTAGPREAEAYLTMGFRLGFNGVLTFKNAEEVRRAAAATPVERLLLETDSPYLAPVPHRGERCEPAHVRHTLVRLAQVLGERTDDLEAVTTENARTLFGI
jgi:TatD DNase family protein